MGLPQRRGAGNADRADGHQRMDHDVDHADDAADQKLKHHSRPKLDRAGRGIFASAGPPTSFSSLDKDARPPDNSFRTLGVVATRPLIQLKGISTARRTM